MPQMTLNDSPNSIKRDMQYSLTLSDSERLEIARALSRLVDALMNSRPVLDAAADLFPPVNVGERKPVGSSPSVPRDRWARDNTGREIPKPAAESYTARIWKADRKEGRLGGPYLDVRWEKSRAYCFDQSLFPWIMQAKAERSNIVLYLNQNGKFQNIIGVKA